MSGQEPATAVGQAGPIVREQEVEVVAGRAGAAGTAFVFGTVLGTADVAGAAAGDTGFPPADSTRLQHEISLCKLPRRQRSKHTTVVARHPRRGAGLDPTLRHADVLLLVIHVMLLLLGSWRGVDRPSPGRWNLVDMVRHDMI